MSDDPRDVRVAELEAEVLALKAENDRLRQDVADLLPEADAVSWAMTEMNAALERARSAELALRVAERRAEQAERFAASGVHEGAPRPKRPRSKPAPVQAPPPVAPAEAPQPLREAPPSGLHGSMADVLGFPKEGR